MEEILGRLKGVGCDVDVTLDRFMGDVDLYGEFVRDFPNEPTMAELRGAVQERDAVHAQKAVHALKGLAGNLGFLPLFDACVDMLGLLREGEIQEAWDVFDDVEEEYARVCKAIAGE